MKPLHKISVSSLQGIGKLTEIALDGRQLAGLKAITIRLDAATVNSVILEFDAAGVEFVGMAEIVAQLMGEEADDSPAS